MSYVFVLTYFMSYKNCIHKLFKKKKIHHNMPKIYKFIKTNFQNTKKNQIKINILYIYVCVCVFFFGGGGGGECAVSQIG